MKNNISLPLFETVFRSFTCILRNFKPFLKICSFFIVLWFIELATNLPSLCSADESYCRTDGIGNLITFLHYIAATIISVSVIRFIILKENTAWFHIRFGKNNIKFIAYNILIALMIIIPSALMIMIGGMANYNNASAFITRVFASLGIVTFIGLCVYCFRLCLVYAGAAIYDKSMTLSKSHTLTNGNMLKIFIGQILLVIPTIILVALVYKIYNLSEWGTTGKSIFVLIGMLISFFDSAVKASYYSHMYQYFIYYSNKQQASAKAIQTTTFVEEVEVITRAPAPEKKVATPKKKTATKKAAPKAAAPKKTTTKTAAKPATKKAPAKKVAASKSPAKKATTSRASAKKAPVKKVAPSKAPVKKTAASKASVKKAPAKKVVAKKTPAKK